MIQQVNITQDAVLIERLLIYKTRILFFIKYIYLFLGPAYCCLRSVRPSVRALSQLVQTQFRTDRYKTWYNLGVISFAGGLNIWGRAITRTGTVSRTTNFQCGHSCIISPNTQPGGHSHGSLAMRAFCLLSENGKLSCFCRI